MKQTVLSSDAVGGAITQTIGGGATVSLSNQLKAFLIFQCSIGMNNINNLC